MTKRKNPGDEDGKTTKLEIAASGAQRFSGSASEAFQSELLRQVTSSLWLPEGKSQEQKIEAAKAAIEAMKNIAPRSELEGMLAAQMISTHNAAMECLRRAMIPEQTYEGRDSNLKHAAKLMALYERQLAALDKHRGKGRQKITVEHVTVEAGGQAIVGAVHTEGKEPPREEPKPAALPDERAGDELGRERLKPAWARTTRARK